MGRGGCAKYRGWGAAIMVAAMLAWAGPAAALNCGSKGQPTCVETRAPGVVLAPPAGGNPYGLTPLTTAPGANSPLWPRVRGHKPYGFHAVSAGRSGTTNAEEALLGKQMGGSIARIGADWGGIQYFPNTGAGGKPWNYEGYLDQKYLALVAQGIRPLLVIEKTPRRFTTRWSTTAGSNQPGCGTSDTCWAAPRSTEAGRLGVFVTDLAKRYPLAAGIELWNEPNLSNPFWGLDPPNPEYYASLLRITEDAAASVNPNLPVVGGALTAADHDTTQNGYPVLSVRTFVRRMLAAGAGANMDAVSYHPYLGRYPWELSPGARSQTLGYRMTSGQDQIAAAYSDAGQPMTDRIVWTETGASTTDSWSQDNQSTFLSYQYSLMDSDSSLLPLASRTDAMFIHETVDNPNPSYGNNWQIGFGFTNPKNSSGKFTLKKAYCTFRTRYGGFSSCPTLLP